MYAALRPDNGVRNLILLTAPLDFSNKECGGFMRWVSAKDFDADKLVEAFGNMPGELIDYGAKALKPVENYIGNYLRLWDNLDDPGVVESWHAMNTWVTDNIPMSGAAYKQLITDFYRENRLFEGRLSLRGELVDLARVRAALLDVVAEQDHIVPPNESESILSRVSSDDKELLRVPGGHIGIMAGSQAIHRTWPKMERWLEQRSQLGAH